MAVRVTSEEQTDDPVVVSDLQWHLIMRIARLYGWTPERAGPVEGTGCARHFRYDIPWGGRLGGRDGEVSAEEADALAEALYQALVDIRCASRWKPHSQHPVEQFKASAWDGLVGECRQTILNLVRLLRGGSVRIRGHVDELFETDAQAF